MSLRRMMFASLGKPPVKTLKNVALASNGGTVALNSVSVSGNVNNIIKGYRQVPISQISSKTVYIASHLAGNPATLITLDFGGIKSVSEINFCHGVDSGNNYVSEEYPNTNLATVNQIPTEISISYSSDNVSFVAVPNEFYGVNYLFSKNELINEYDDVLNFDARYLKIQFFSFETIISGIEVWGLNY